MAIEASKAEFNRSAARDEGWLGRDRNECLHSAAGEMRCGALFGLVALFQ